MNKDYERLSMILKAIKRRCRNKNDKSYVDYGGRGITICKEWQSNSVFTDWAMNNGYKHGLVIDRRDNDKGYSPDNCRFVDRFISARNTRMYKNNRSGYRGVHFDSDRKKYRASIQVNNKKLHIGLFSNPVDAAVAYDSFVINHKTGHHINFCQPIIEIKT